ncbi:hypothetical protein BJX70DRAFT_276664 [Aspergillus crustosus]
MHAILLRPAPIVEPIASEAARCGRATPPACWRRVLEHNLVQMTNNLHTPVIVRLFIVRASLLPYSSWYHQRALRRNHPRSWPTSRHPQTHGDGEIPRLNQRFSVRFSMIIPFPSPSPMTKGHLAVEQSQSGRAYQATNSSKSLPWISETAGGLSLPIETPHSEILVSGATISSNICNAVRTCPSRSYSVLKHSY